LHCVEWAASPKVILAIDAVQFCINAGHSAPDLISVYSMDRSIFYIIGVIVVVVIVLKLLHVF
jgi:hypothetical protein